LKISKKDHRKLLKAQKTIISALDVKGIEEEARVEGRLILAQILLQGQKDESYYQAKKALEESNRFELIWLAARSHHVLGNICSMKGNYIEAVQHYEQAMHIARKSEMRLELAKILLQFGHLLTNSTELRAESKATGEKYIDEAYHIFEECGVEVDLQAINNGNSDYLTFQTPNGVTQ
jgi:tetratricopeptide (TPR) repeat protein